MGQIKLFQNASYGGKSVSLTADNAALSTINFNDRTSSIAVESGTWILYQNAEYHGKSAVVKGGDRYEHMNQITCVDGSTFDNDSLSAVRLIPEGEGITLFQDSEYRGTAHSFTKSADQMPAGFNDSTSSIYCSGGTWTVWQNAGMTGDSFTMTGPARYPHSSSWGKTFGNDSISSVSKD